MIRTLAVNLATLLAASLLLAIWVAAGGRVLRRLNPAHADWPAPLSLVTQALLGQGLGGLLVLLLGGAGVLHPWVVLGIYGIALLWLRSDLGGLPAGAVRLVFPVDRVARVALALWVVVGLLALLLSLSPPWEWDTLMYHQDLPLEFLHSGAIRLPEDNFHVAVIGIAQLASLPLLAAGLPAGPAAASALSYLLLPVAVLALARVTAEETDGWWSVLVLAGLPGFLLVATTARIDVTVAWALVVAHALLIRAAILREGPTLMVSALCFGIAGGMKLHALAYAAASAPVVLLTFRNRRAIGMALVAFAVALVPWLVKNAWLMGAPFYPVGAAPKFEPWLARIAGADTIPGGFDVRVFTQLSESRDAFNLWDAFFAPHLLTIEGEGRFYGLPLVLLLLPFALFAIRRMPAALALALPPLVYLALIIVPFPATNLRYLFPAIAPLVLATVIGVRSAVPRVLPLVTRYAIAAVLVIGAGVWQVPALKERIGQDGLLLRWAVGAVPLAEVRARHPHSASRQIAALENALAGLPGNTLVLLLWEARTAGIHPSTLADLRLSNWPLLSQTNAGQSCLSGTGITHVVINRASVAYYLARGALPEAFRIPQLGEFTRRCLVQQGETHGYLIFRVAQPSSALPPGGAGG